MVDFSKKLILDLVQQFRDKPNIEALSQVIARQLQDVFSFYEQLRTDRNIGAAIGKQLDGIGDLVVLTRSNAGLLYGDRIPYDILDDEKYRKFLTYKVLKNTSRATYEDIVKASKMLWNLPVTYREDPKKPATLLLKTTLTDELDPIEDLYPLSMIRAAGVGYEMTIVIPDFNPWVNEKDIFSVHRFTQLFRFNSKRNYLFPLFDGETIFNGEETFDTAIKSMFAHPRFSVKTSFGKTEDRIAKATLTTDNMFYFDGTVSFDGSRNFDPEIKQEEL